MCPPANFISFRKKYKLTLHFCTLKLKYILKYEFQEYVSSVKVKVKVKEKVKVNVKVVEFTATTQW